MVFRKIIINVLLIGLSHACSETILRGQDGSITLGRTIDYDYELEYVFSVDPKGTQHESLVHSTTDACKNKTFKWTNRHKRILIQIAEVPGGFIDGINEHGLSAALLYLHDAVYKNPSEANCEYVISQYQVADYILANFENVAQVKEAIESNNFPDVVGTFGIGDVHGLHYPVTDKTGAAIVIEYTAAGRRIHENTLGVVTNHPSYDWQMENFKYHIHLRTADHKERTYFDTQLKEHKLPVFPESGLIGMPGDYSSPSRFIRAGTLVQLAAKPETSDKAIIATFHILNSVDVPIGPVEGIHVPMRTFWLLVKDLTNGCIYYRTYDFLLIRKLCLPDVSDEPATFMVNSKFETLADSVEDVSSKLKYAKDEL